MPKIALVTGDNQFVEEFKESFRTWAHASMRNAEVIVCENLSALPKNRQGIDFVAIDLQCFEHAGAIVPRLKDLGFTVEDMTSLVRLFARNMDGITHEEVGRQALVEGKPLSSESFALIGRNVALMMNARHVHGMQVQFDSRQTGDNLQVVA